MVIRLHVPLVFAVLLAAPPASALEKQGAAHGARVGHEPSGFDVSGNVFFGGAFYNPTYAARPDNTGLALLRFGGHGDIDLIGRKLSIPIDLNFFTDRTRDGAAVLLPTEIDVIAGVTTTWELGDGALELGVRGERDAPIDRGTFTQEFIDVRARYIYSVAEALGLDPAKSAEDLRGWVTLGGFVVNPTYAARPDNSGLALLRYVAHVESVFWTGRFSFAVDTNWFTDRETNAIRPSELDLTLDAIFRVHPFEFHLAYERDLPVDRSGLVQQFIYGLIVYGFDVFGSSSAAPR